MLNACVTDEAARQLSTEDLTELLRASVYWGAVLAPAWCQEVARAQQAE